MSPFRNMQWLSFKNVVCISSHLCYTCVCLLELIHTELHHIQTLQIMERVFRQGMLEELQLEPSTVHAMFPCLDQLIKIHSQFLAQLLLRRKNSLQPGSNHNYTIHQLGDILVEQVCDSADFPLLTRIHSNVTCLCSSASSQASLQMTCRRLMLSSVADT